MKKKLTALALALALATSLGSVAFAAPATGSVTDNRDGTQNVTGLNDDGSRYLSKGVKWVSYFYGGEGFHTASWNNYGIAHGDPAHYGSHGCVNMYEADSKWIYDNCPEGTIVQVVGAMPSGPVR